MKSKFKKLSTALIVAFSWPGISVALGQEVTWDDELFGRLLEEEKYDEAFEVLNQPDVKPSMSLYQQRGFLLGSGLLSTEIDRCAAVLDLERAYALGGIFVGGALDFLYGGDWAGIAALEGNPDALVVVGLRLSQSTIQSNPFLLYDKEIVAKDAYGYIYAGVNSSISGFLSDGSEFELRILERDWPEIDFSQLQTPIEFQPIRCPVRVPNEDLILSFKTSNSDQSTLED